MYRKVRARAVWCEDATDSVPGNCKRKYHPTVSSSWYKHCMWI